jgi:hypothetical protein
VSLGVIIEEVVERDDLDVGTRSEQRAVKVAANAAEAVDTNTDGHDHDLLGCHEALGSWANDHLNELGLVLVTGGSS